MCPVVLRVDRPRWQETSLVRVGPQFCVLRNLEGVKFLLRRRQNSYGLKGGGLSEEDGTCFHYSFVNSLEFLKTADLFPTVSKHSFYPERSSSCQDDGFEALFQHADAPDRTEDVADRTEGGSGRPRKRQRIAPGED